MNSYRRLISNTALFSISTFGSKILVFLLTPFYTSILTESEYGVTDLLIQTGSFLIPLVSLGILNAVLRFGLDDKADKPCIFTTGLLVIVTGSCILALFCPLLQNISLMSDYTILLLLYVLMANIHSLCGSIAQAMGRIRLYAVSGILCTASVVGLNILLLSVFRLGITGYVLSNVIADAFTALLLFFCLRLWKYFRPAALRGPQLPASSRETEHLPPSYGKVPEPAEPREGVLYGKPHLEAWRQRRKTREAALPVAREECVFGAAERRARRTMPRPPAGKKKAAS